MSGRQPVARAWRPAAVLLAAAILAALAAAAVAAARATAGQEYWAQGLHRLLRAHVWQRFDRWGAIAAAAALGGSVLARRHAGAWLPGRALSGVAVAVLLAVAATRAADGLRRPAGPNVLLVSIDTLRADHVGAYGAASGATPVIDRRLAAEGVVFETAFSHSPKTTPSHMTMLTSLPPCAHGVELWLADRPAHRLNPRVVTLAEVLRNAGWATAAFTGAANLDPERGFADGFARYRTSADRQVAQALAWLGRHRRERFFVFLHSFRVHDPYLPPADLLPAIRARHAGPIVEAAERLRAGASGWEQAHATFWQAVDPNDPRTPATLRALYDGAIADMDRGIVAPLLDGLDRLGLARDTLVVFTSDHGEAFGEHGRFRHDDLHAGTLHVPLVLRLPGRLPAGRRVAAPVRLLDLMPTILDLAGVPRPPDLRGRSLVPLATGNDPAEPPLDITSELGPQAMVAVRRGPLVLLRAGGVEQLFETRSDPGELRDRATAAPAELAALRAAVARWQAACAADRARFGSPAAALRPGRDTLRQLRALGYVE